MRLLFVGNFLSNQPGVFSISEAIGRRLIERGHQVLLTSRINNRFFRLADMVGASLASRNRYDVAHVDVFSGPAFLWAEATCQVLRWLKKPYVLTLHGGNLPEFARLAPERVRRFFAPAVCITAPSQYLFEQMQPYAPDLVISPNPIDVSHFQYRQRQTPKPELLWLRAFHNIYNPTLAVKVLARLAGPYPQAHLSMVGRDKLDGALQSVQAEAQRLGVADKLSLPGGIPNAEVSDWIDRADIFLNTTNFDNTPVSVLEAMAGGMCVVSTNVGGIPYLLEHEQDALLAPAGDEAAMAGMVSRLLSEPGLAARLSLNARKKVEKFDWSVVLPQWEGIFADALR
jgi:glycosyltransferase involved in cell wall biosynthesis